MKTLALVLIFIPFLGKSQISFQHISLKEAKALAIKENKPIFADVYATWCGPCKYMASTTFMNPEIGTYFNKEFINVKIDGEKEDGPNVMHEYGITAYPTLLFISAKGELVETFVGAADIPTLKRLGIKVAHPDQDPVKLALNKFHKSNKNDDELKELVSVLNANADDSLKFYSALYLATRKSLDFNKEFDRLAFLKGESDPFSLNTNAFTASMNLFQPKEAHDFMVRMILETHEKGINNGSFDNTEKTIRKFYPYLAQLGLITLPDVESLVNEFKMQFEAQ